MQEVNSTAVNVSAGTPETAPAGGEGTDGQSPEVHIGVSRSRFAVSNIVLSALAIVALLLVLYLSYRLLPVLMLIFVSVLFATAIEPVVERLKRGPFNRAAGILVVYTSIFVLIGVLAFLTVPIFLNQVGELGTSLPKTLDSAHDSAQRISSPFVRQQTTSWVEAAKSLVDQLKSPTPASGNADKVAAATQTTLGLAEAFFSVITFFVVAFYWLTERALIKRSITSWLPSRRANRVRRVWDDIEVKVGGWVRGQLTLMLIIGLASAVGYFLMGVKFWPAMALFICLCEAIPLVGPYIGTAPAILVALTQTGNDGLPGLLGMTDFGNVTRALLVVGFAVVLQTVEGNVLVPRIMKNSVGISPLTVIISLLIGASLAGLLGALLAVPIAGSVQVIIQDIRTAHDQEEKASEALGTSSTGSQENVEVTVSNREAVSPAGTTQTASTS